MYVASPRSVSSSAGALGVNWISGLDLTHRLQGPFRPTIFTSLILTLLVLACLHSAHPRPLTLGPRLGFRTFEHREGYPFESTSGWSLRTC